MPRDRRITVRTHPWQNISSPLFPFWLKGDSGASYDSPRSPLLAVYDGWASLGMDGAAATVGATTHIHWWGGHGERAPALSIHYVFTNLVQGLQVQSVGGTERVVSDWYSTKNTQGSPDYGPSSADCKDLRNNVSDKLPINNFQALTVVDDGISGAPRALILAATPGGSVVAMRPGNSPGGATPDYGTVVAESGSGLGLDDGHGAMALVTRPTPGAQGDHDVFVGVTWHHLDPAPFAAHQPSKVVGAVRLLRWHGGTGSFSNEGLLILDASSSDRGGYCVAGLAIGDAVAGNQGEELVVTTLDGDLFVFEIPAVGVPVAATPIYRTAVPAGSLGACDSIVIDDLDGVGGNEIYVSGSMGIWKWVSSTGGGN